MHVHMSSNPNLDDLLRETATGKKQDMAPRAGIEPTTHCLEGSCILSVKTRIFAVFP